MEKQNAAPKAPGEQQLDGIGNNAKTEDFRMKNKVYEIIKYGNIALKDFPKYERATLAREIRQSMYTILRLVITLENKHYKKTTLGELDTEVDVLRHFIRLAADEEMYPDKRPCLYMDDVIIIHNSKRHLEKVKKEIAAFLESRLHLQLNNKTCIRPVRLGAEFVGFRVWSTHVKLRKKTAKKMIKRLEYVFAAYHAGEMDREKMNRTVASYKGILKHFNSHGMAQKLNDIYRREVMGNAAN